MDTNNNIEIFTGLTSLYENSELVKAAETASHICSAFDSTAISNMVNTISAFSSAASAITASACIENFTTALEPITTATEQLAAQTDMLSSVASIAETTNDLINESVVESLTTAAAVVEEALEPVRRASTIVESISKAMMHTVDLFAGIGGLVKEIVDRIFENEIFELMHAFGHCLLSGFYNFFDWLWNRRKERHIACLPHAALTQVILFCPCVVRAFIIRFLEHSVSVRSINLLRPQDRGSADDGESYIPFTCNSVVFAI